MNRRFAFAVTSCILLAAAGSLMVVLHGKSNDYTKSRSEELLRNEGGKTGASDGRQVPFEALDPDRPLTLPVDLDLAEGIREELLADLLRKADTFSRYPVHPGRAALQEQMRQETMAQTFEHVADNDNIRMLVPAMGSIPFTPGCYPADLRIVSRATRVRKLLADAGESSAAGTSRFYQDQLRALSESFRTAYEEFEKTLRATSGKVRLKGLPEVQKQRLQSTIAVYVLSEIGAYDALPLLAKLSTEGKPNLNRPLFAGSCQVNPVFLLYSMHRLVKSLPEDDLTSEARRARLGYLSQAAKAGIQEAQPVTVPSWKAMYDENDSRSMLPGGLAPPEDQPTIALTIYPTLHKLSGGEVQELLHELRVFVEEAFPGGK